jgi:hypothetical protein
MRIICSMCLALAGILLAGPAIADTVTYGTLAATFHSEHSFAQVDVRLNNGSWTRELAGLIDWQRTGGTYAELGGADNSGYKFYTFCVELTQNVYFDHNYTYTVVDAENAGSPVLGATRANLIRELWGLHAADALTSAGAAAFQLAVWEIVYDTGANLASGSFQARATYTGDPIPVTAQTWLGQLNGSHPLATLYGMSHPTIQDQVVFVPTLTPHNVESVPLPSAVWAGAMLLAGLIARRIRRHRSAMV